jgi:hypothetical protein
LKKKKLNQKKKNQKKKIKKFKKCLKKKNFPTRAPQEGEEQILLSLLGKEVKKRKRRIEEEEGETDEEKENDDNDEDEREKEKQINILKNMKKIMKLIKEKKIVFKKEEEKP